MGFFTQDKVTLPTAEQALPGRTDPIVVADKHIVLGSRMRAPFPDGMELAMFGMGCFWGVEKKFWQVPGVYSTQVGYAGGLTPNATYREVCSGQDRPQRGRARRLRSDEDLVRDAPQDVLGEPRSDAGHASGQRRRHAVPLGHLHVRRRAARRRRELARRVPGEARGGGLRPITTEIVDAPPFYYAEDYHQQYLAKNPDGYCGLGGTGVSCPIGIAKA